MTGYVLAHDLGTSGNKASLVDAEGKVLGSAVEHYPVLYPQPGWAEQDPETHWWHAICKTTHDVLQKTKIQPNDVAAIVFATQMMGTIPVDSNGKPLMNCMTWMDTRAAKQNKEVVSGPIRMLRMLRITGGLPSGKDSIGKIIWLREERPVIFEKTHKFLDCKDYLVLKCTGRYMASHDCASVTWFMNSKRREWSDTILDWMQIDAERLPDLAPSTEIAGNLTPEAAASLGLTTSTQVVNGCGDMAAAAVGSGAVREKEVHLYAGSSAWMGAHVRQRKLDITTYTGSIRSAIPELYFCVAEQESAGACLKHLKEHWHCDLCQKVRDYASPACSECISGAQNPYQSLDPVAAGAPPGSENLLFAPWLFGERSPINDHSVRGGYFNLSLAHEKKHMVRAVLEGVAYHTRWMMDGLEKGRMLGHIKKINMIGGCANSDLWPQIYADVMHKPINRMAHPLEAGSIGASVVAFVGLKWYDSFEKAAQTIKVDKVFEPNEANFEVYDRLYETMKVYYKKNKGIWKKMNAEGH